MVARARAPGDAWDGRLGSLMLVLFSGVATATYAGYRLETSAWSAYVDCNPPPVGYSCTYPSFWNLPPTLNLVACLTGVAAGVLLGVVGWMIYRRSIAGVWGSYLVMALALAGLVAYGGLGIGTTAGMVAGLSLAPSRRRRLRAPSEWSGYYPAGVRPVQDPPRAVTGRPSVSAWDGIVHTPAPARPAERRVPTRLPSADRLAATLRRASRSLPPRSRGEPDREPPSFVLLPPPPTGVVHNVTAPQAPPTGRTVAAGEERPTTEPPETPAPPRRTEPHPARTPDPGPASSGIPRPATHPSAPPALPVRAGRASRTEDAGGPGIGRALATPTPERSAPGPPRRPDGAHSARTGTGEEVDDPRPSGKPPAPPVATSGPRRREDGGAGGDGRQPPDGAERPPALPGRQSDPVGPTSAGQRAGPSPRVRAWTCSRCRQLNAPWSPTCTRCGWVGGH